jgi:hypothetical protein
VEPISDEELAMHRRLGSCSDWVARIDAEVAKCQEAERERDIVHQQCDGYIARAVEAERERDEWHEQSDLHFADAQVTTELFVHPVTETVYSATISEDGLYRYRLGRSWGHGELMAWVMLNPSTADAEVDDPTIRRCMSLAKREGYDGIEVLNLYGLRATKPKHLLDHPDPEGPQNLRHWDSVLQNHRVGMVVAAWGAHAGMGHLPASVAADHWRSGVSWRCLGITGAGYPRHPLYVRGDTELIRFRACLDD